mgnify:CR=1 FL=1
MTNLLESLIKKTLNLFNLRLIKNSNFENLDFPIEANNEIKKKNGIAKKKKKL